MMGLKSRARRAAILACALLVASVLLAPSASATTATGNLPAGTGISVDIATPAVDQVYPQGSAVAVTGTAAVQTGVVIKDTTVIYVIDQSGSMALTAGVDCTGDAVNDSR